MTPERQAIVDALAKVPGLTPTPAAPAPIVAGSAWTGWSSSTPTNACVTQHEYYVFVALPNGHQGATIDAGDEIVEDVATVLWAVAKVIRWRTGAVDRRTRPASHPPTAVHASSLRGCYGC